MKNADNVIEIQDPMLRHTGLSPALLDTQGKMKDWYPTLFGTRENTDKSQYIPTWVNHHRRVAGGLGIEKFNVAKMMSDFGIPDKIPNNENVEALNSIELSVEPVSLIDETTIVYTGKNYIIRDNVNRSSFKLSYKKMETDSRCVIFNASGRPVEIRSADNESVEPIILENETSISIRFTGINTAYEIC